MADLGVIYELIGRAGTYAALRFSADTADPATGALLQKAQEQATAIETTLLFFELEWAALPQERADELLDSEGLDFCRHHLRNVRRYREHLLSEPEEKILAEKVLTGAGAWARLFEELTSAIEVDLPGGGGGAGAGEKVALDVALSRLSLPDREIRRATAEAITAALAPGLRTRAFVFNTLLADKATDDRLRRYPHWLAERNLANEASDESVRALIEAVRGRYEIARRWYRLKARLLGVERLADYDRMASVTEDEVSFTFAAAREIVLDCYASFAPELGEVVQALLRGAPDRRAGAPGQARRGLLRVGRALGAALRAAQLHLAQARRADAGPRAGPRRALLARRPSGHLPAGHAADPRRDGLGVRRDDRVRAAAWKRTPLPPRAWRSWRRTSRTRSPRSSARWR